MGKSHPHIWLKRFAGAVPVKEQALKLQSGLLQEQFIILPPL
jgi:hypothetical protein